MPVTRSGSAANPTRDLVSKPSVGFTVHMTVNPTLGASGRSNVGFAAAPRSAAYSRCATAGRKFATPPIPQNAASAINAASPLPAARAAPTIGITTIGIAFAAS